MSRPGAQTGPRPETEKVREMEAVFFSSSGAAPIAGGSLHEIRLEDMELYSGYIRRTKYPANLWSSSFAYLWAVSQSSRRKILWRIEDGMFVVFGQAADHTLYLPCLPAGAGDPEKLTAAVRRSLDFCSRTNGPEQKAPVLKIINEAQLAWLRRCPDFDRYFRVVVWQGIERHFDVPGLSALKGKQFEDLRNRTNKFRREHPEAKLTRLQDGDIDGLLELGRRWEDTSGRKYSRVFDGVYYREIIRNSDALGQITLVMRENGRIIGMVSGGVLPNGESWGSLVKFDAGVPGLSETLLVEFAREIHRVDSGVGLMNVGSDLGPGGLREYKLKFRPVLNYKRYQVSLR